MINERTLTPPESQNDLSERYVLYSRTSLSVCIQWNALLPSIEFFHVQCNFSFYFFHSRWTFNFLNRRHKQKKKRTTDWLRMNISFEFFFSIFFVEKVFFNLFFFLLNTIYRHKVERKIRCSFEHLLRLRFPSIIRVYWKKGKLIWKGVILIDKSLAWMRVKMSNLKILQQIWKSFLARVTFF